jgi:hypothetical protein
MTEHEVQTLKGLAAKWRADADTLDRPPGFGAYREQAHADGKVKALRSCATALEEAIKETRQ